MLALNVSKEAVEAFKKVDNGLTQTIANYTLKNDVIYKEFDRAASENPAKAGKYKTLAYQVKEFADGAYNFIQGLKIERVKKAEKDPETPAINGNQIVIDKLEKHIDDTNVPSEILIGANENGKANDLKALLAEYRQFLITTLDGKNPTAEAALKSSLNTDDQINKDGVKERWENYNFQTLPLVAVICILSEYQVSVRNGETEVLNYLYSQIDASSYKFTKLVPIVYPVSSNYVTLGSDYEAQVFISATDTTQSPNITVSGSQLPLDEAGRGIYKIRATSTGARKWGGIIALKAPNGTTINYPFDASYVVGEPNVIVSPTAMNVMYMGIPNPIDVSVPGISPDKIKIKVNNGSFSTEKVKNSRGQFFKGAWSVKPNAVGQDVQIVVTADINGKPVQYPPYPFRVKSIPDPVAQFGKKSTGSISRADALAQQGVFAIMPDFDFELNYTVTGFTVFYTDKGMDIEASSSTSLFTPQQRRALEGLTRGKNLMIKDIKAVGPDNKTRDLNAIVLKIN
jgi:gliding motility-associated protein GldM